MDVGKDLNGARQQQRGMPRLIEGLYAIHKNGTSVRHEDAYAVWALCIMIKKMTRGSVKDVLNMFYYFSLRSKRGCMRPNA